MLETCEESLFSGLTAVSATFAEDRFPAAHRYFCSRNNTGCFAHLFCLDSSSDPKPPQDVLNLKGAVLPSPRAANASEKSQLLAVDATNAASQKNTKGRTLHLACAKAGPCPGLPVRTVTGHPSRDCLLAHCASPALFPAGEAPGSKMHSSSGLQLLTDEMGVCRNSKHKRGR